MYYMQFSTSTVATTWYIFTVTFSRINSAEQWQWKEIVMSSKTVVTVGLVTVAEWGCKQVHFSDSVAECAVVLRLLSISSLAYWRTMDEPEQLNATLLPHECHYSFQHCFWRSTGSSQRDSIEHYTRLLKYVLRCYSMYSLSVCQPGSGLHLCLSPTLCSRKYIIFIFSIKLFSLTISTVAVVRQ